MEGLFPIIRRKRRSAEVDVVPSGELVALREEVAALKVENQRLQSELTAAEKQLSRSRERR